MKYNYWKIASVACIIGISAFAVPVSAEEGNTSKPSAKCSCSADKGCRQNMAVQTSAKKSGIDLNDLDKSVSPREDFYNYAIGNWRKHNPIPDDQSSWGSFHILAENNTAILHEILEEAAKNPSSDIEKKLGDYYASGMNTALIEKLAVDPVMPDLTMAANVKNIDDLQDAIAYLHTQGIPVYFVFVGAQDDKDSSRVVGTFWQHGLGLPERDYYLRDDKDSKSIREAYHKHISNMFMLLGDSETDARKNAEAVIEFETELARASLPAADLRDPERVYHMMSTEKLQSLTPNFNWKKYFKSIGVGELKEVNVCMPDYASAVSAAFGNAHDMMVHRNYLRWHIIRAAAPYLSSNFEQEYFNFYSTRLRGVKVMKPRWKRVVGTIDGSVGQALGQLYVKRTFPPEAKAHVEQMVKNILAAMREDIPTLPWMSDVTKKEALKKLDCFKAKIGYPDVPLDYSAWKSAGPDHYYDNVRSARTFEQKRSWRKIGRPVDHNEWHMPAQKVNAYYDPSNNEIVFPAGILQPPFFDPNADDAVNYGGIGMVIGHEVSHGFDDQGAQYDGHGNLRNWWTPEDLAAFQKLAKGVEEQFSSYESAGLKINGKLVLGESIADLSGMALAWKAYQKALAANPSTTMDGFTPEQRFFLGYAKIWATNMRPESEKLQVNTDPHPAAKWRVNGPLSNMVEFYNAFGVQEGDPMRRPPELRNKIW